MEHNLSENPIISQVIDFHRDSTQEVWQSASETIG